MSCVGRKSNPSKLNPTGPLLSCMHSCFKRRSEQEPPFRHVIVVRNVSMVIVDIHGLVQVTVNLPQSPRQNHASTKAFVSMHSMTAHETNSQRISPLMLIRTLLGHVESFGQVADVVCVPVSISCTLRVMPIRGYLSHHRFHSDRYMKSRTWSSLIDNSAQKNCVVNKAR